MSPRISVAMATYNGERYLQEQLDSLAEQTHLPCELVVGDDGSTDGTLAILEAFAARASFPVRIIRNTKNLGYADNFLQTASTCSGEWIAFCDQDDVWLPNKLDRCANAIRGNSGLTLVLQNAELCDKSLNARGHIYPNSLRPGVYQAGTCYGFWVWLGFLQTVNASVLKNLQFRDRPPNYFPGYETQSHDKWICMIANALGGICVLREPVALYRRHENSLTGSYDRKPLRHRVDQMLATGAGHYAFLAEVASESAAVLRRLAESTENTDWTKRLSKGAVQFDRLAKVQSSRARLYNLDSLASRIQCFAELWTLGGYIGPTFSSMGWGSALKDLAVTLGRSRHAQRKDDDKRWRALRHAETDTHSK
jgi:glycosyltransferase involved in cell wall biosynthesis